MQQNRHVVKVLALLALLLAAGAIFLIFHEIPAPTVAVEQAIPADRFLKP